jgi:hypothetical protein
LYRFRVKKKVKLILDSGAYTAWRLRREVSLTKYIAFIHKHNEYLHGYMNLDVMPGTPGGHKTQPQVEESARQGWENLCEMKAAGLKPIPVYHMGERRYWLEKMIDAGYDYIALGGVAMLADEVRQPWLDEIFDFLCRPHGYPPVRIHGLGITSSPLLLRYPWTSVDSVSWLQAAANGTIYVPRMDGHGEYDYSLPPFVVHCSVQENGQTSKSGQGHGRHLGNFGGNMRRYVLDYLEQEKIGEEAVRRDYIQRDRINIRFFQRLEAAHPRSPFLRRHSTIFKSAVVKGIGATEYPVGDFRVHFVIAERRKYGEVLTLEKAWHQLVTFFWFQTREIFDIPKYITTGELTYTPKRGQRVRIK